MKRVVAVFVLALVTAFVIALLSRTDMKSHQLLMKDHAAAHITKDSIIDAIASGAIKYCNSDEYVLRVGAKPVSKKQLMLLTPEDNELWRESVRELFALEGDQLPDLGVYLRRGLYPMHNYVIGLKAMNGTYCEVFSTNSVTLEPYVLFNKKYQ